MESKRKSNQPLPLPIASVILVIPVAVFLLTCKLVFRFSRPEDTPSEPQTGLVFQDSSSYRPFAPLFPSISALLALPKPLASFILVSDVATNTLYQIHKNAPAIAAPVLLNSGGAPTEDVAASLRRPGVAGMAKYDIAQDGVRVLIARNSARDLALMTVRAPDPSTAVWQLQVGDIVPIATAFNDSRLNSPHSICVDDTGNVFFSDPTFGLMLAPDEFDRALDSPESMELDTQNVYYIRAADVKQAIETSIPATPRLLIKDIDRPVGIAVVQNRLFVAAASPRKPVLAEFHLTTSENGYLFVDGEKRILYDWKKHLHGWGQKWFAGVAGHISVIRDRWLLVGAGDGLAAFDIMAGDQSGLLEYADWIEIGVPPGTPNAILDDDGKLFVSTSERIFRVGIHVS